MSKINYNIAYMDGDPSSVSVVYEDGSLNVAMPTHANWDAILRALTSKPLPDTMTLRSMFDVGYAISQEFQRFTDQVTYKDGKLLFDLEPVQGGLATAIINYWKEDQDTDMKQAERTYLPLVRFLEKCMSNPIEHSRNQLFNWIEQHKFSIQEDGDFVVYKGVKGVAPNKYKSSSSGTAWVNGEEYRDQQIPTSPGSIVEMPRGNVAADPDVACSTGLHAGTWAYASTFGDTTLEVSINPRDVVSVPRDCDGQKIRVCRYYVMEAVTEPQDSMLYPTTNEFRPAQRLVHVPAPTRAQPPVWVRADDMPKPFPIGDEPGPIFYEDFRRKDFENLTISQLRWLVKEWNIKTGSKKADMVKKLTKKASNLRARKPEQATVVPHKTASHV